MRTRDITRRLLRAFDNANAEQKQRGERWYDDARATAEYLERAYALSPGAGAGIIAALSPRIHWNRNITLAKLLCTGMEVKALGRSLRHARAIAQGARTGTVLNGPKTRAFAACISRPSNPWAVCIDVWAARAAGVDPNKLKSKKLYNQTADAYRAAAKMRDLNPAAFQAVIWIVTREAAS